MKEIKKGNFVFKINPLYKDRTIEDSTILDVELDIDLKDRVCHFKGRLSLRQLEVTPEEIIEGNVLKGGLNENQQKQKKIRGVKDANNRSTKSTAHRKTYNGIL